MIDKLRRQGVSEYLLEKVEHLVNDDKENNNDNLRIPDDNIIYLGKEIWEQAITAILQGENILLVGPKSTGKNLLANNLSSLFNRPNWNVSLNINTDEAQLIGVDTFKNQEVIFRDGPITAAAKIGGFVVYVGVFSVYFLAFSQLFVIIAGETCQPAL